MTRSSSPTPHKSLTTWTSSVRPCLLPATSNLSKQTTLFCSSPCQDSPPASALRKFTIPQASGILTRPSLRLSVPTLATSVSDPSCTQLKTQKLMRPCQSGTPFKMDGKNGSTQSRSRSLLRVSVSFILTCIQVTSCSTLLPTVLSI